MEHDKALQKALNASKPSGLPYGFENKIMNAIYLKAEKQAKRRFALSILLVSFVSLIIISVSAYVLHLYYSVDYSINMPRIKFTNESKSIFLFSFYIATIVLVLLGLDGYLRRLKKRTESNF